MPDVVLEAVELTKSYDRRRRGAQPSTYAVDRVSLAVHRGETLGIVGESGSGKSTLARMMARLTTPTSGTLRLDGADVSRFDSAAMTRMRRQVQMVFQDPYASLDPRMRVGQIVGEPLAIHRDIVPRKDIAGRVAELLDLVGLSADDARRYPHQFSGGQRQRIGIARALATRPSVLICDEAVSALDVSVQAQIVNLVSDLTDELGLTCLFISHDLAVVKHISDRVAIMNNGVIEEIGQKSVIYAQPQSPYTRRLLAAIPVPDPRRYRDERSRA